MFLTVNDIYDMTAKYKVVCALHADFETMIILTLGEKRYEMLIDRIVDLIEQEYSKRNEFVVNSIIE